PAGGGRARPRGGPRRGGGGPAVRPVPPVRPPVAGTPPRRGGPGHHRLARRLVRDHARSPGPRRGRASRSAGHRAALIQLWTSLAGTVIGNGPLVSTRS